LAWDELLNLAERREKLNCLPLRQALLRENARREALFKHDIDWDVERADCQLRRIENMMWMRDQQCEAADFRLKRMM
jgi:hypothetical protein